MALSELEHEGSAVQPRRAAALTLPTALSRLAEIAALAATAVLPALLGACGGGASLADAGAASGSAPPQSLSYASPQSYTVGTAIAPLPPSLSGSATRYAVVPPLPPGLALDTASGVVHGTPSLAVGAGSYRISAYGGNASASFDLTIAVRRRPPLWLEPGGTTILAQGQSMPLFVARQDAADPYPRFLAAAQVAWSSSAAGVAEVAADGTLRGVATGSARITASHQGASDATDVQVRGRWVEHRVAVAGQGMRDYAVYLPEGGSAGRPLLLSLHGGGGSPSQQAATSRLVRLAHEQQLVVAFLSGSGVVRTFNAGACCGFAQTERIDDVLYVRRVIDDVEARYASDPARVFASGLSNGGMMSHRLACEAADRIAGIAAVAGASGQFDSLGNAYYACAPSRPLPVLMVHATNDRNYPYAGGSGEGLSETPFYGVEATLADWLGRNNLLAQPRVEPVTGTTQCRHYERAADAARPSARVTLCTTAPVDVYDAANGIVFGGGHSWPGGARSPSPSSDVPVADFDAGAALWGFFAR